MTSSRKTRKQFVLDQRKIQKAKKILGAKTETETVDRALDVIIANDELDRAHQEFVSSGVTIRDAFGRLGR
jgi:Arc/MetJ family transcription regulator